MQVSFACTDHGLKAPRNGEHSKQSAASPNTASKARARFRTVALIARSLGSFTHRYHHNLKESTAKLTGMKYRYVEHARHPPGAGNIHHDLFNVEDNTI
ncbi:Voltage-gated potassium channel subunit beta-1 [Liparis tanakae]|uniref:Voltage-gated potassium channel subunit beta-1 n=1 Tax=Liparis tanakae TaxID=230148 RepID=A0A4Z2EIG6_9TELE|nr:Voltage-gated potassium channel subunit beta-1 [Liparis tanakae]